MSYSSTNSHVRAYVDQRLSLHDLSCTVRYVGAVTGKAGEWLGVEWDDPGRGKHNGTFNEVKYFECRSSSLTAASFLRPEQPWDLPRTLMQALREKYMPEHSNATDDEAVYISGKQAEEVGFAKFATRQARLQGIHSVVVDHMRIRYRADHPDNGQIEELCAGVTDLDLTSNVFETSKEAIDLCRHFPKLRNLTLSGNRFSVSSEIDAAWTLPRVNTLSLNGTFIPWKDVIILTRRYFPNIRTLDVENNELQEVWHGLPDGLEEINVSFNRLENVATTLAGLETTSLKRVNLRHNRISTADGEIVMLSDSCPMDSLNLSFNAIASFAIFDKLHSSLAQRLRHLQVTGNPLYADLKSLEGKSLTSEDGYMLTIARLPHLQTLNYSRITEKERLNAEMYYLKQIGLELARTDEANRPAVLKSHPRYRDLCEEYGEPAIPNKPADDALNSNSLAARLVAITISFGEQSWIQEVPRSFNIYALLGLVGKRLRLMPLDLRLVWETGERDPVGKDGGYKGPEWWDSDDEEEVADLDTHGTAMQWVQREVELVAGTRALGTYMEGREARVRVELK